MKIKSFLLISFVILVTIYFIRICTQNTSIDEHFAIISSSVITAVGWSISSYLNTRSFQRSEIIKNKDHITNLIDALFRELLELAEKRSTSIEDIDNFITTRVTIIEFKANQLEKIFKENCQFISNESLTELRSKPIDIFENSHSNYKELNQQLNQLKNSLYQDIEDNYNSWLKNQ
ncbi:hypothetical protein [Aggregatibacter aphrophilus]|uniref:Uncharacterized protein n=1 Tax=Aggregatibacter aphrophilus ATCC 33389 TaxID=985008 RepID=A0A448FAS2_AGGAP|nr:hypothetical protein [Aggregatibacter aphrophilus]KNE85437.1 hypothetical protein ATCC33389_0205920 [Aggregatibacter aphrophilus ATCC 33389]OBY54428.1 hypothetical protein BBB51_04720 [Aggregatibacter aphrophilus]RDE88975.1 hypothetical protein DPW00_01350 [Aggregatibacter aphrophilus]VEF44243.1 Uncharacterised protein [Aggregatibacter aphrophilus ATCC 33389]